jgi:hypothetical protein
MPQVRVHNFAVSLDGFSTGEGQSLEQPFGHAGTRLLDRFLGTRTYHKMHGEPGGSNGADEAFASNWGLGIGAEIMGRNKFGPQRGPWVDEDWKGWWGDDPVFHTPVFVLTPSEADHSNEGRNDLPFHRCHARRSVEDRQRRCR